MKLYEKKMSGKEVFTGKIFRVHVDEVMLENHVKASREVVEHSGGVSVVAITDNNEIIFVRQFRYPYGEVLLELPAGKLEKGEIPFKAVQREQLEETGTTGRNYISLGTLYPSPGYCNEKIYLWACRVDTQGESMPDEDEFLETVRIPIKTAVDMVINGEIPDAKTQVGVLKVAQLLADKQI